MMSSLRKSLFIACFLFSLNGLFANTDSTKISVNLYTSAFFDNKEFTGDIKKGYTIPGFFIQPTLGIESDNFKVDAGFHIIYAAGTDSLEKFVPIVKLTYLVSPTFKMIVGNIDSKDNHQLPEPLFKTERFYLNQPELGVQFKMDKSRFKGDLWVNWEKYIKNGSPFQEQFTVGFVSKYKPASFEQKNGIYASAIALATHQGGQIDSTGLPVTTLINLGGEIGHHFKLPFGNADAEVKIAGYLSSDKSPSPHTKYKNGTAIHPKIAMIWPNLQLEAGYWYATTFVNPRGEELYGSTSTINELFDEKKRELITMQLYLNKMLNKQFNICTGFNAYIDIKNGITEYSYVFRLTFDGRVYEKP
ncbi:MAG: hypothetical protein AB7S48_07985 [Bacteroidales bacterium]